MRMPTVGEKFTGRDGTVYTVIDVTPDDDGPGFLLEFIDSDDPEDYEALEFSQTDDQFEAFCQIEGIDFR